jgi:hypothetical protein
LLHNEKEWMHIIAPMSKQNGPRPAFRHLEFLSSQVFPKLIGLSIAMARGRGRGNAGKARSPEAAASTQRVAVGAQGRQLGRTRVEHKTPVAEPIAAPIAGRGVRTSKKAARNPPSTPQKKTPEPLSENDFEEEEEEEEEDEDEEEEEEDVADDMALGSDEEEQPPAKKKRQKKQQEVATCKLCLAKDSQDRLAMPESAVSLWVFLASKVQNGGPV